MPRAPGLDAVLQMGPHKGRAEGDSHLCFPAGHPSFDAARDAVGLPSERLSEQHFLKLN